MYTLGIPNRQKRRALGYLKKQWLDFEEHPSDEGFVEIRFPDMGDEAFRDISNKLKQQGVTLIGVDTQLTERKIMKLTDLIKEENITGMESTDKNIMDSLKNMFRKWGQTQYMDDKQRGDDFYLDIEELIQDFGEEEVMNYPINIQNTNLHEDKVRKAIRKLIRK
jgi:hypothetical protein